jgi:hypothetical protein
MKITESVRQTNMSYKRCLTGPCERLKAETGKRGSDRHDRPNPLQDILVIVENIRGNILSISFLIPWDSCPRNQQRGDIRLTRKYEISSGVSYEKGLRDLQRRSARYVTVQLSLGLESIRSNTSFLWIRVPPQSVGVCKLCEQDDFQPQCRILLDLEHCSRHKA